MAASARPVAPLDMPPKDTAPEAPDHAPWQQPRKALAMRLSRTLTAPYTSDELM
jgi:hypothetical protein